MARAPLTAKKRKALPSSSFAIPGRRAYPIDTPARARAALTRVRQFGSPAEQRQVIAAVKRRYPNIDVETKAGAATVKQTPAKVKAAQRKAARKRRR